MPITPRINCLQWPVDLPRLHHSVAVAYLLKNLLRCNPPGRRRAVLREFAVREHCRARQACSALPPPALLALHGWRRDYLGIRYINPLLPFRAPVGRIAMSAMLRRSPPAMRIAAALLLSCGRLAAAAGIYPYGAELLHESACTAGRPRHTGFRRRDRCVIAWLRQQRGRGMALKRFPVLEPMLNGRVARLASSASSAIGGYDAPFERVDDAQLLFPAAARLSDRHLAHLGTRIAPLCAGATRSGRRVDWCELRPRAIVGHGCYDLTHSSGK